MDVGRYLVEAHLREGRPIGELARTHGVHRSWLYKLLGRYRREGAAGLLARSRRPKSSPRAMPLAVADEIVALRARLLAEGLDAGALTIQWHLSRRGGGVPSASSIIRVLRRRGLVVPEPRKRPRSSFIRFAAALPNELWQTDATHWVLGDGSAVEILNVIDDHSRLLVAATPFRTVKAADAVAVFHQGAGRVGYPRALLSDNAAVFSGASRQGKVLLETELLRLGIGCKHAAPYHPQTCGKVERFHQTQKRWLAKQPPAATLEELSAQLDRQRLYYNLHRPHRAIGRRTPQEVFDAKCKAGRERPRRRCTSACATTRSTGTARSRCVTTRGCTTSVWACATAASPSCCSSPTARCASSTPTVSSCGNWSSIRRATTSASRPDVYDVLRHRLRCRDTSHSGQRGNRTPTAKGG